MEKHKNTPKLRFPEFVEDWVKLKFNDILTLITRPIKMEDENDYSLVTVKRNYGGIVSRGIFKGEKVLVKSQFLLNQNDFLISKRQIVHNACGIVPKEHDGSIVSNEYSVCIPKPNLDIKYFYYFCHLPSVSRTFLLSSIGVHLEKMLFKIDVWFKWEFMYPSYIEQQKIVSFLLSVENRMKLLIQKKEKLEQYKRGIMQKIFCREINFKDDDGNEFPEWGEIQLGDVYNITSSKRVFQNEWTKSGVPFYRAREVVKSSETGNVENDLYISTSMYNNYKVKYGVPQKDDLLVTGVGTIGKLYVVKENENFYFKDGNIIWFKKQGIIDSQFVKFLFQTQIILKQIEDNASTTTVGTYTIDSAKKTTIPYPCLAEQNKIATFLLTIDENISQCKDQIIKTEQYNKGLLQQLFI